MDEYIECAGGPAHEYRSWKVTAQKWQEPCRLGRVGTAAVPATIESAIDAGEASDPIGAKDVE